MKKIFTTLLITCVLTSSLLADTDGEKSLSKKNPSEVKDCFESVNRATFKFNQVLDGAIFEPLAKAYRVLPSPVRVGTNNAMNNLSNLVTIPNNVLQGEFKKAGQNTFRFVVNSTVGIVGIFDVAKNIGLPEYEKEDFGQTFGKLGIREGCYVVIPVLGPSTVRDVAGSFAGMLGGDPWYNITAGKDTQHFSDFDYWASKATSGIDFRSKNIESFENLEKNSMDFYASVRSLYLQDRQKKIANSITSNENQNDSDWEEVETQ